MDLFPANFEALAQEGGNPALGGYPYRIKGSDLMRNFVHAALDADDNLVENAVAQNGYSQRKLKIDAGTEENQLYIWDGNKITVINATPTEGSVLVFTGGAFSYVQAPSSGTHVLGVKDGTIQWIETEEC